MHCVTCRAPLDLLGEEQLQDVVKVHGQRRAQADHRRSPGSQKRLLHSKSPAVDESFILLDDGQRDERASGAICGLA